MVEKDIKEVVLEDIDSVIEKAKYSEEFTPGEVAGLITAKAMIEREVGD